MMGMLFLNAAMPLAEVAIAQDFRDILEDIGDQTNLENYQENVHADASDKTGVKNITSAIFFVIDFLKYLLGSIAVLMLIIHSMELITAGKESEDQITKGKNFLKYALFGLVLVFVSEEAVKLAFFGEEGEVLRSEESAAEFARAGGNLIEGIYTFLEVFIGSIAVLMLVMAGFEMLVNSANEEAVGKARTRIWLAILGLVIIGVAELVVKDIIFKDQGQEVDVERGRQLIVQITNFLVSVIGTIAVGAFVYAGFLYVLNFGNEDSTGKAKKIMFGAVIGIVLAAAAFAIVSTVVPVEGAQ